jgi:hypothetical protein
MISDRSASHSTCAPYCRLFSNEKLVVFLLVVLERRKCLPEEYSDADVA